jgi:hypothetical protein
MLFLDSWGCSKVARPQLHHLGKRLRSDSTTASALENQSATMLWRVSSPRHYPAGFIEPCLPMVSKRVPRQFCRIKETPGDEVALVDAGGPALPCNPRRIVARGAARICRPLACQAFPARKCYEENGAPGTIRTSERSRTLRVQWLNPLIPGQIAPTTRQAF